MKAALTLRIDRKLEIVQNVKLLEISQVARKLPSNLWKGHYYFHKKSNDKKIKANEVNTILFVVALDEAFVKLMSQAK